jgi:hypothetical protein
LNSTAESRPTLTRPQIATSPRLLNHNLHRLLVKEPHGEDKLLKSILAIANLAKLSGDILHVTKEAEESKIPDLMFKLSAEFMYII